MKKTLHTGLLSILLSLTVGCGPEPPVERLEDYCDLGRERTGCLIDETIILNAMADVEAICAPGCTRLGHVILGSNLPAEGFEAFRGFEEIETLRLTGAIESLEPLSDLRHVDQLDLRTLTALETVEGLDSLETVGIEINIADNHRLRTIDGFTALRDLRSLYISNNDALRHIAGFDQVTGPFGMRVEFNRRLESVAGFNSVREIGGVTIEGNDALQSLGGFSSVESGAVFEVRKNDTLSKCVVDDFFATLPDTIPTSNFQNGPCE